MPETYQNYTQVNQYYTSAPQMKILTQKIPLQDQLQHPEFTY